MRRCKQSGWLALSISELDAAEDVGVPLRALFRGESWAWKRVEDALDNRAVNRESVSFSPRDHYGRAWSALDRRAADQARSELLHSANAPIHSRIEQEDAAVTATNALLRAVQAQNDDEPDNLTTDTYATTAETEQYA